MKSYLIVIEKDQHVAESISMLAELLNFKPVIFFNWNYRIKNLPLDEIAALCVNIDILMIKPEELLQTISQAVRRVTGKIPLIYIFQNDESLNYRRFSAIPHTAEIRKPFSLEDFYNVLRRAVTVSPLKSDITVFDEELSGIRNYLREFDEWLSKINTVMGTDEKRD